MTTDRIKGLVVLVAGLLSLPSMATAGNKDFVIYVPGMGGNAQQAKPFLATFLRELEKQVGWAANSSDGQYSEELKQAAELIAARQPGFGLISPALFVDLACRKEGVEPVASIVGASGSIAAGKYHVVVKDPALKDLKDLQGKKLSSNHLENVKFVSQVVFGGKLEADKHFKLEATGSPLKPFKLVLRGEADAALVDDAQLASMKTLPDGASLKVVFSSQMLPPFPVVAFTRGVKPADRDQMRKVLLGFCSSAGGAGICKSLQIARFEPIEAGAFKAAVQQYCKP